MKSSPQQIEIYLNFIGEVEFLNAERVPTKEEIAEQECIEKERERNRLRYIKRKAQGYYDKPKAKHKKTERTAADLPMAANQ